ncbi:MAG: SpvB/TcaC N-terminal domain-containing protein, partial [Kiritimatiellales bacterium]
MKKQLLILLVGCSCCCGFAAEDAPPSSGDGKSINDQAKFELPGSGSVGIGGSYTFSYPISGAPGRSGLSRKTGLSYNSAHLSDQSLVGYGWNIPMMAVQRNSRFGVDQLYTTNSFYTAPGAGELILVSDGAVQEYRARIEGGFVRWFYDTSAASWCSYDRDGVKTTYGSSDASRVADTNTTAHIYAWYVERIEDIYGNFVRFDYWKDEGEIYPREIVYTGNGTDDGLSSIRFQPFYKGPILHSYYMRPDMTISYDAGFKTQRRFRLNAVEAYAGDDLASRYELSYTNGSTDVRSLLHSITRIGNDGTNAMPSSTFEYQTPKFDALPETHTNYFLPEGLHLLTFQPGATNEVPGDGGVRFEDINGDSLPDLLYANGCTNENNRGVWLNTGSGWKKSEEWELPSDSNLWFVAYVDEDQTPDSTGVTVSDVNGDGRADILMAQSYIDSSGDWVDRRHVWLNTGSNWVEDTSWTFPTNIAFLGSFSSNGTDQVLLDLNVQMPDLNGDGYPDLVYSVTNQTSATSLSGGHLPMTNAVWLNTGNGWVATDGWVLPDGHSLMADLKNDGSSAPRDGSLRFIDLNGDGLADLLYANGHQWGYEGSATASGRTKKAWLNTGSGWERNDQWNLPEYNTGYQGQDYDFAWFQADHPYFYFGGSSVSSPFTVGLRMKDVNGDGLPDLILSQLYNYSAFTSATNWSDLCTNHCAEIDCATNVCATSDCNWDCEDCDYACESNCLFDIQACIAAGNDSNDCLRAYQTCLDAIIDCQQQKEACLVRQAECLLEKEACSNQVQECYNECTDYVQNSDGCFTDCMDLYLQLQDEQIYSAVWLNTGNGWIRNDDYLPAPESRVHFVGIYTNGNTMTVLDTRMNLMDLNGDGTPEYMADSSEPVLGLDDPRMVFSGVDGREMLVARHNPFGATETISYTSTVQTPDFKSPSGFRVVDSVLVEDGFGMAYPTFYDYSGGWFFVDSSGARRNQFRGFHQRSVVNAAGVRTVSYYHQGGGPDGSLQGEYNDTEAKKGSVYRTEIYGSNDMLYASTVTRWEQESYADGTEERWWPVKTLETSFSFTESGAHREAAVRSFCNPATGLTEEMHMLGEVSADPATGAVLSETVNDSDDETYVFTQYQSFSGIPYQYITGRPESIEVTSDPSGNTRLGLTEYSWFPDSSPQSVSRWLDTTGEMVVEQAFLDYDDYGNVTKARNAAGLVTEFTYDSTHHMYPVSISAGGRLTTMVTDSRSGKTLSVTDHSSGTVASNSYDTFFRPQTSWKDGVWQQTYEYHVGPAEGSGAQEIYTYVWVPGYWQEGWSSTSSENDIWIEGYWKPTPVEVVPGEDYAFDNHIYVKINTGSGIDGDAEQIVYADGLGRTIQTRIESERDDGAYRVSNTVYDEEGRITYAYE